MLFFLTNHARINNTDYLIVFHIFPRMYTYCNGESESVSSGTATFYSLVHFQLSMNPVK